MEIAAAGGHNVLMVGVPGSGKTMLARRRSSILPEMTKEEAIEVTKIYSISGLLGKEAGLVTHRPFRSPHHTSSTVAMIGGGSVPRPGEVLSFTSSIILIVAMNPCPCGYYGDKNHVCECSAGEIKRYTRKISGPLLDRIDIHIRVSRVDYNDLHTTQRAESSAAIRARVVAAREAQRVRLKSYDLFCNAQMNHSMIKKYCRLQSDAEGILEAAFHRINLSARSLDETYCRGDSVAQRYRSQYRLRKSQ